MNFYASNLGGAINYFAGNYSHIAKRFGTSNSEGQAPLQHFHCDFKTSDQVLNEVSSSHDFRLFSRAGITCDRTGQNCNQAAGDFSMFPKASNGEFDRTSFKVSKRALGRFNRPLNAYIAPEILSAVRDAASATSPSAPAPIGYGVQPWKSGDGTERCPSAGEIAIPPGHRWVKLWLFRAEATNQVARVIPQAKTFSRDYLGAGIFCKFGDYKLDGVNPNFPACESPFQRVAGLPYDRILATQGSNSQGSSLRNHYACLSFQPTAISNGKPLAQMKSDICEAGGIGCASDNVSGAQAYSAYADGTDVYTLIRPNPVPSPDPCQLQGTANLQDGSVDPFRFCSQNSTSTSLRPHGSTPGSVLQSQNTQSLLPIDTPDKTRNDFVFVVSPEIVHTRDIFGDDSEPTELGKQFTPIRAKSPADCRAGTCSESAQIRYYPLRYDLNLPHEKTLESGSQSPENNTSPISFPMCVLQEDSST